MSPAGAADLRALPETAKPSMVPSLPAASSLAPCPEPGGAGGPCPKRGPPGPSLRHSAQPLGAPRALPHPQGFVRLGGKAQKPSQPRQGPLGRARLIPRLLVRGLLSPSCAPQAGALWTAPTHPICPQHWVLQVGRDPCLSPPSPSHPWIRCLQALGVSGPRSEGDGPCPVCGLLLTSEPKHPHGLCVPGVGSRSWLSPQDRWPSPWAVLRP